MFVGPLTETRTSRRALVLLAPLLLVALIGVRAVGARYYRGDDYQLNAIGVVLVGIAIAGAVAAGLSCSRRLTRRARLATLALAIAITAVGVFWGIPAELQSRNVAHGCACAGN